MSMTTQLQSPQPIPGLEVVVYVEGTVTVIALRGEADIATLPFVVDTLARAIAADDRDVVIDLAQTAFIDTATLRAILSARGALMDMGRRLAIRPPTSRIAARVLAVFGLSELVTPIDADRR